MPEDLPLLMSHIVKKRALVSATRRPLPPAKQQEEKLPEVNEWVERVKDVPDLRWDKIQAVRQAIENNEYDVEGRLGEMLNSLPEELGALAARTGADASEVETELAASDTA